MTAVLADGNYVNNRLTRVRTLLSPSLYDIMIILPKAQNLIKGKRARSRRKRLCKLSKCPDVTHDFAEANKKGQKTFFVAPRKSKLVKIDHFTRRYIWNSYTETRSLE